MIFDHDLLRFLLSHFKPETINPNIKQRAKYRVVETQLNEAASLWISVKWSEHCDIWCWLLKLDALSSRKICNVKLGLAQVSYLSMHRQKACRALSVCSVHRYYGRDSTETRSARLLLYAAMVLLTLSLRESLFTRHAKQPNFSFHIFKKTLVLNHSGGTSSWINQMTNSLSMLQYYWTFVVA